MMLISVDTGKKVYKLPHYTDYQKWRANISDKDYEKVVEEINKHIDNNEVNTSSWMPGNEWEGTVYEPLFYACGKNKVQSGLFFGLIVFKVLMERTDAVWGFGRFEYNGKAIKGMTYFRTDSDPKTL